MHQHQQQRDPFELDLELGAVQEGREWVWPSGRRTPVISGASDMGGGAPPAPDSGGGAPPAPAPDSGAPPAPDAGAPPAPDGGQDMQTILNQLRGENEKYRKTYGKVAQHFDGIDDADLAAIGGLAQALKTDPQQAVQWMLTNAQHLAGDQWQQLLVQQLGGGQPAEKPRLDLSDPDQFNKAIQEQVRAALEGHQQTMTVQEQTQKLQKELDDAGVQPGSIEWNAVVAHMQQNHSGVQDAVDAVRGYFESQAETYARKKAEQARKAGTPPPSAPAAAPGGPAGGSKGPLTMKDAEKAMQARIDANLGAGNRR